MSAEIRKTFGCLLQTERERLGFSQAQFAAMGGTKPRTLQDWERGASTPSAEFLSKAAKFGLDVQYVLTGERAAARQHVVTAVEDDAETANNRKVVVLDERKQLLIARFEAASEVGKTYIEAASSFAAEGKKERRALLAMGMSPDQVQRIETHVMQAQDAAAALAASSIRTNKSKD